MTELIDAAGFLSVDPRYLGAADVWQRYCDAVAAWRVAIYSSGIRADVREQLYAAYLLPLNDGFGGQTFRYEVIVNGHRKGFTLGLACRRAADAIKAAKADLAKSAVRRMEDGEIEVLIREADDPLSAWKPVAADRMCEFQFYASLMQGRRNRVKYRYLLRDTVGLPLGQALHVYGERAVVEELNGLRFIGAPDRIGRTDGLSPEIDPAILAAPERYTALLTSLKACLLEMLADGKLVATEVGSNVPAGFWRDVNPDLDVDVWRPGALLTLPVGAEPSNIGASKGPASRLPPGPTPDLIRLGLLDQIRSDIAAGTKQREAVCKVLSLVPGASSEESKTRWFEDRLRAEKKQKNQRADII